MLMSDVDVFHTHMPGTIYHGHMQIGCLPCMPDSCSAAVHGVNRLSQWLGLVGVSKMSRSRRGGDMTVPQSTGTPYVKGDLTTPKPISCTPPKTVPMLSCVKAL